MRAAVNDRPRDAVLCSHLPLTGEFHPLRREFERWLATGNAIALAFAMLACAIVYFWPREATITLPGPVIDSPIGHYPSPPPIDPARGGGGGDMPAFTPNIDKAMIEPVDDPVVMTSPYQVDNGPGDGEGYTGPITDLPPADGGLLVIPPRSPSPEDFVPFDNAPVMLSCEPPVYPAIVREAGIDGTVNVRVLVGVNGRVKDAYVVDGPAALREAALASARTALFKPALQGVHPVEVWVVVPITFELRAGH